MKIDHNAAVFFKQKNDTEQRIQVARCANIIYTHIHIVTTPSRQPATHVKEAEAWRRARVYSQLTSLLPSFNSATYLGEMLGSLPYAARKKGGIKREIFFVPSSVPKEEEEEEAREKKREVASRRTPPCLAS